ncbi:MAG: AzlD domain-containing protein [Phycicoccus sp.]
MTDVWVVIGLLAVVTMVLKAVGPWALAERDLPPDVRSVLTDMVPAVLAALVVVDTVVRGGTVEVDARTVGVAVAAVAVWLRAPLLLAVAVAVLVTALGRATVWS